MLLQITGISIIFWLLKFLSSDKQDSPNICPSFILSSTSVLVDSEPSSMLLLDGRTSILKGRILAFILVTFSIHAATILDLDRLHLDIWSALVKDISIAEHLTNSEGYWLTNPFSLLFLNSRIYILSIDNFYIQVFQYYYDHILADHCRQNKMLKFICHEYT